MSLRILVIHNPVAGRRRRKRLRRLLQLLEARGHHLRVRLTTHSGDAHETARDATDIDVIVAAGGDGTVNEVVNGLAARTDADGAPSSGVDWPLVAFMALGTANVLAWELGLSGRAEALARTIEGGETIAARPGVANGRRFVLMASAGLDARAVAAVRTATKRLLGGAAYLTAAVRALRLPAPPLRVTLDGETHVARTVIVTRARCYGGPFVLLGDAGLETDQLHVVMLRANGWWAVARYGLALVTGRLAKLADVEVAAGTKVFIDGPDFDPVQMDGDLAATLPLEIELDPRPVRFLVPRR